MEDLKILYVDDDINMLNTGEEILVSAGFKVSYSSVCKYIRTTLGHAEEADECFIRQRYSPGRDCEFDWGEMCLTIDGRRTKLYIAVFTMAYSNYRSAFIFLHQDTQAFLESHRLFFRELGHVPHRMVYDNMRVAVKDFVGGKHPTDALVRLEAAYGFTHRFCNAHRGNEKGHVERSVEVVRRAAFCRVDTFESVKAAQVQVAYACSELNTPLGVIGGGAEQKIEEEWGCMLPLVREVGCFEQRDYTVDKYGTVVIGKVHYSVPDLKVCYRGEVVCEHERTPLNGWKLDIMHYLTTLRRKPGAVAGSVALYMLRDDLKLIFESHFAESPADFVILLQKTRDRGLSLDDIVKAEKCIYVSGAEPLRDPVLFSWNLQAGLDLRVLPGVRLYVAPAASTFLNRSAYKASWDKGTIFSLRAGLSFDLK